MTRFCPNGHENPEDNRFCQQCGTQIGIPTVNYLITGVVLGDRYRIKAQIGQGGFGRTYLCEAVNRFNELCVLKEFAPQVQGTVLLGKAQALFEREAGVMYQLQHPQIPKFIEIFRVNREGIGQLFLVQDFVEGTTYQQLLRQKLQCGQKFTEAEITEFLAQILPVLSYIHALGVIHRDISPDNLIKRDRDGLPVLIDFGGVKQVAVNAANQYLPVGSTISDVPTRLGKIGYAPNEQMQRGVVFPHSDLYALAATALVLLTGKEPPDLIDPQNFTWSWREHVELSDRLSSILDRMLRLRPQDRFQSADDVLTALTTGHGVEPGIRAIAPAATGDPLGKTSAPVPVTVAIGSSTTVAPTQATTPTMPMLRVWSKTLLAFVALSAAVGIGWVVAGKIDTSKSSPTVSLAQIEPTLPDVLANRGVDRQAYGAAVKQIFTIQNPDVQSLPSDDERLNTIASALGQKLTSLDLKAVQKIGKYRPTDRSIWRSQLSKVHLSERAAIDLTDTKYRTLTEFTAQKLGLDFDRFLETPLGQIYLATMADRLQAILSKQAIAEIVFPIGENNGTVSGTLQPGEGMAYIANLSGGQDVEVKITANELTALSIYPPSSNLAALLTAAPTKDWSGKTSVNGDHEFVLVSQSDRPVAYQLKLTAHGVVW